MAAAASCFCETGRPEWRRAEGYSVFLNTFRRVAFLSEWSSGLAVAFDESLSHKVYELLPWESKYIPLVRSYFQTIPFPFALVYVACDTETVLARVRAREQKSGRLIKSHKGLSDQELMRATDAAIEFAEVAVKELRSRGVITIQVDGKSKPDDNVKLIMRRLKENVTHLT